MSLYVDKAVTADESAIQVDMAWHPRLQLVALAAYSEDRGGTVDLVDRYGYNVDEGQIPAHPTAQASALAWHPLK